nr:MAG TPA: tail fiber-like protein [Caudoviricetes sp.]
MANVPKAITDLPVASAMGDDDLLVVSQNATTSSIKGELIKGYAQNAVASQVTAAQTAANQAGQSATQAEAARQGAAAAQTAAENAQDAAETARDQSVAAAGTIGDSVEQAQTAAGQASSARDAAVSAQSAAETAKTAAETASGQAQTAATQASGSATAAQTAATQAGDAKTDAETARNEAETSASSAANSASDAENAAAEAEQAKTYIENMDMDGETLPAGSSVTVTKTTSPEGNLLFVIGVPQGIQGDKGDTGETGATGPQGVSVTNATVNEDGDLVITLSAGKPINAGSVIGPQGIQGETGPTGASVDRIERTSGTGAPGTTDTYTVYLTDGQTGGTFQVYNGSNGTGFGDFMSDGSVPMTGALQMGGHKITDLAEPTDNTDAASKEYVDDTITVSLVGNYIPVGQKGQANGVASLDGSGKVPNEQLPPMDYVPTSRTVNGHALSADVTLDAEDVGARPDTWTPSAEDVGAIPNPSGGTAGQVLTKTADGSAWENAPSGLPDGGTEGQIIKKTADGAEWDDAEWLPLSGGTMSGDIAMGGHKITNLGAPTNANDAVRQADLKVVSDEVDGIISGTTGITLAPATTTKIGGVIVGDGIEVEANGTISTNPVPAGGTTGQVLTKTSTGEEWSDAPSGLPEGGTEGQILAKTSSGAAWVDAPESGLTQEQADERYLQLSGGTLTGALTLNGEPTEDLQAAPKQYVDALKPLARTITLTTSRWTSNTQKVIVSGVSATETAQLITPTPAIASQSAYYEAGIMCTKQAKNSLTFTCQTVPTSNLTVYVVIQPLN